jgi:hypothetical protein
LLYTQGPARVALSRLIPANVLIRRISIEMRRQSRTNATQPFEIVHLGETWVKYGF